VVAFKTGKLPRVAVVLTVPVLSDITVPAMCKVPLMSPPSTGELMLSFGGLSMIIVTLAVVADCPLLSIACAWKACAPDVPVT
jgi:hypothetical protein